MTLFEIVGISNSDRNSDLYWIVWNLEFLPSSGSLVDALHSVNFYSPFIRMFKQLCIYGVKFSFQFFSQGNFLGLE